MKALMLCGDVTWNRQGGEEGNNCGRSMFVFWSPFSFVFRKVRSSWLSHPFPTAAAASGLELGVPSLVK